MSFKLRRFAFNLRDRIQAVRNPGRTIGAYVEGLEKYQNMDVDDSRLAQYHARAVGELIQHATESCDYYRAYSGHQFSEFPVITKATIQARQAEFLSNEFDFDALTVMRTSGSTGAPFEVYQDSEKRKRLAAELIYFYGLVGYQVGDPLVFLAMTARVSRSKPLRLWMQNQRLIDITDLSDMRIFSLLKELKKVRGATVLAYPTTFEALSIFFRSQVGPGKPRISALVSSGAILHDATRNHLRNVLECRFVNRYSNQENGVLGQDDTEDNVFVANVSHYYTEILHLERDEPVEDGQIGRVVVTDLYNYGMPMIRYDTGDIAAAESRSMSGRLTRVIKDLSGRKLDMIFDEADRTVSPHTIVNAILGAAPAARQVQFIQIDRGVYLVRIAGEEELVEEGAILRELREILGMSAKFSIEYTNDIPVLSSGKRQTVISEYRPFQDP